MQLNAFNVKAPVGLMVVVPLFRILTVEPFIWTTPKLNVASPEVTRGPSTFKLLLNCDLPLNMIEVASGLVFVPLMDTSLPVKPRTLVTQSRTIELFAVIDTVGLVIFVKPEIVPVTFRFPVNTVLPENIDPCRS